MASNPLYRTMFRVFPRTAVPDLSNSTNIRLSPVLLYNPRSSQQRDGGPGEPLTGHPRQALWTGGLHTRYKQTFRTIITTEHLHDWKSISLVTTMHQDYHAIHSSCWAAGELWTDPRFPPQPSSLYYRRPIRAVWRRPGELCTEVMQ